MTAFCRPRFVYGMVLLCLLGGPLSGCLAPAAPKPTAMNPAVNPYRQRVKYQENRDLVFADFTLRYTGQTKKTPPQYGRPFTYYNFVVVSGNREQKIAWSSGTGAIGPQAFTVGGKTFWLELQISDTLGRLAPDELVAFTAPPPAALKPAEPKPFVPAYGQRVNFKENPSLIFADFTLFYVGREAPSKPQNRSSSGYQFLVAIPGHTQPLFWKEGANAPLVFSVGKKSFSLTLQTLDKSASFAPDELTVLPAPRDTAAK